MADHQTGRTAIAQGQSANLADVLERVLDKGIVIAGDVKLLLADIEVLTLQIRLVVCSVDKAREIGLDWWRNDPAFSPDAAKQAASAPSSAQQEELQSLRQRLAGLEQALGVPQGVPGK